MPLQLKLFGQLTDLCNTNSITMEDSRDTDILLEKLFHQFPELRKTKFIIAVDNKITTGNTLLTNESIVALLPPFSGG